ncbi:MAG: flagellar basal body rod protein FlgB [Planctomycetaceae bacterium]
MLIDMASFNEQINLLSRLISAAEMRQQVIGHNIANVNTPNFRRLDVNFEQALAAEMARGASVGELASKAMPTVSRTPGLITRADGNNVDIDQEIGQMNKNALLQQVYLQMVGAEMGMMRRAIDGR